MWEGALKYGYTGNDANLKYHAGWAPTTARTSGGSRIGTKERLNKEDLELKLKIKGEFTLSYSINEGLRQLRAAAPL